MDQLMTTEQDVILNSFEYLSKELVNIKKVIPAKN